MMKTASMKIIMKMLTPDQERVKMLLCETITMLCKNGLRFESELQIDGLIGITLDRRDVFLVTMKELVGLQDDLPYVRQYQQNCCISDRDVSPEIAAQQNTLSLRQPVVITPLSSPKSVRRSTLETRTSEHNHAQVPDNRFHRTPNVSAESQNQVSNSISGLAKHRDSVSEIPSTVTTLKAGTVEKCGPEMTLEMAISGDNEMATLSERHVVRVENRLGDTMSCNVGAYTENRILDSDSAETTRTAGIVENNSSSSTRSRFPRNSIEDRSSVSQSSVVDAKEDCDSDDQVVIIKEEPGTSLAHRGEWKCQSSDLEPWKKINPHFPGFSSHCSPHPGILLSAVNMQHPSSESRQRSHSAQSSAAEWDGQDPSAGTTMSKPSSTTLLTKDHMFAGCSYASRNSVDGTSSDVSSYQDDRGQMEMAAGGGGRLDTSGIGYPPVKPRSMRSTFTRFQTSRLELEFERSHYVSKETRMQLMRELNLSESIITVWFQNRRQKLKLKLKAHAEYLSSHGANEGSG